MEVFVGNLSPRTTQSDLVTLFKGFAKEPRFQIHDKQYEDGSRTRYAVIDIESEKSARKAIAKLHGKIVNGNAVIVREFFYRSYGNERRAVGWRDKPWHGVERRNLDRRRKNAPKEIDFDKEMGIKPAVEEQKPDPQRLRVRAFGHLARKH